MLTESNIDFSGQQIGNYKVEQLIASRKINTLYQAIDISENRPVYLSVASSNIHQDPDFASQFRLRMEKVARLHHPDIATIDEIGVTPTNQPYITLEFFEGEPLSTVLANLSLQGETLQVDEALNLVLKIANILKLAHQSGIIHHDLRPENIFIKEKNTPILMDLGNPLPEDISTINIEIDREQNLDYASPEQIQGKRLSPQSNIYSLGIILYELLAGHRPEIPTSEWDIFDQNRTILPTGTPLDEVRTGLSPEIYRLVRNCMWREEWNRYESIEELIVALNEALAAEKSIDDTPASVTSRRWLLVFIPFLILVLWLGYNFLDDSNSVSQPIETRPVLATPTMGADSTVDTVSIQDSTKTSSVIPSPFVEPTAREQVIEILTPLYGSEFVTGDDIIFEWSWPSLIEANQLFVIYLIANNEISPIGNVRTAIDGTTYSLQIGSHLFSTAGTYDIQIILEDSSSGDILGESQIFTIIILPQNTPTPSPTIVVNNATNTPSLIPTETPIPTPECEIIPPPTWSQYTVKIGDTLSTLAFQSGTSADRIMQVNCLTNNILSIGKELWLPTLPATIPPSSTPTNPGNPPPPPTNTPAPPPTLTPPSP